MDRADSRRSAARWLIYLIGVTVGVVLVSAGLSGYWIRHAPGRGRRSAPAAIDCARVVAAADTDDRGSGAVAALVAAGLDPGIIKVHRSARDPESHKRGCYTAHRAVHREARAAGCGTTLVIEDDARFAADIGAAWDIVDAAAARGFDTLWLGYLALRLDTVDTNPPGLVAVTKPMLAHAVVFSAEASARVADLPDWTPQPASASILEAYDVALWYQNVTRVNRTVGVYPPVAYQLPSSPESLSLDKQGFVDWVKGETGIRLMAANAVDQCLFLFRHSISAVVAGILRHAMQLSPDSVSLGDLYTCA